MQVSNYIKQCDDWRNKFLDMDIDEICSKIPELKREEDRLTFWYFGRHLAVDLSSGIITCLSDDRPIKEWTQLNVYTLFWYCVPGAKFIGEWLPFGSLKNASPFDAAFKNGIINPIAAAFSGHSDLLPDAVEKLRGFKISEHSFQIPAFACIPVRVNFWDGDDEFPAQANLLFDKSATDFIHVESIVTIASELTHELTDAAGLSLDGHAF